MSTLRNFPMRSKRWQLRRRFSLDISYQERNFAAAVIRCFEKNYEIYLESCSLKGLLEDYREK